MSLVFILFLIYFTSGIYGLLTGKNAKGDENNVNVFEEKMRRYIHTIEPLEADAAAFDVHGQWLGWGKEKSKDLVSTRTH